MSCDVAKFEPHEAVTGLAELRARRQRDARPLQEEFRRGCRSGRAHGNRATRDSSHAVACSASPGSSAASRPTQVIAHAAEVLDARRQPRFSRLGPGRQRGAHAERGECESSVERAVTRAAGAAPRSAPRRPPQRKPATIECLAGGIERHGARRDLRAEAGERNVLVPRVNEVRMDLVADDVEVVVGRERGEPGQFGARKTAPCRIVRVAQDEQSRARAADRGLDAPQSRSNRRRSGTPPRAGRCWRRSRESADRSASAPARRHRAR